MTSGSPNTSIEVPAAAARSNLDAWRRAITLTRWENEGGSTLLVPTDLATRGGHA